VPISDPKVNEDTIGDPTPSPKPSAEKSEKPTGADVTTGNAEQENTESVGLDSNTTSQNTKSVAASHRSAGSRGAASGKAGDNTMGKKEGGLSAAEAQGRARNSQLTAQRLASNGDVANAFQELLSAWQGLQQHTDNPACRALAKELNKSLKEHGESLNQRAAKKNETAISRKPLTVE